MAMEICLNCKSKTNMNTCLACEGHDLFEPINENGAKPKEGVVKNVPTEKD
jgi:hypothetical protein